MGLPRREDRPSFHKNYYEVCAENTTELGQRMAFLFGDVVHGCLKFARKQSDWPQKIASAWPLWESTLRYFPRYTAELESYANTAEIPLPELWALNCEGDLAWREKCTTFVTNDGGLIAHNEDWDDESENAICVVKKRLPTITILELYYYDAPLGGNAFSINSHGYVHAVNSLQHSDYRVGVPKNVTARWLSETSDIASDFAKMAAFPRASGFNHVVVDRDGIMVDIETTATRQRLFHPRLPYVHTNHYLSPEFEPWEEAQSEESSFHRYARACRLLRPEISFDDAVEILSSTTDGTTNSIMNKNTIARVIVDLPNDVLKIWLKRERKQGWVQYPLSDIMHQPHLQNDRRSQ